MIARTPDQELSCWLASFDGAMPRCDFNAAMDLFLADAFWRDLVAFSWNVHTSEGHEAIRDMLGACLARTAPTLWQAAGPARLDGDIVEATATFETATARCSAVIRLKRNGLLPVPGDLAALPVERSIRRLARRLQDTDRYRCLDGYRMATAITRDAVAS